MTRDVIFFEVNPYECLFKIIEDQQIINEFIDINAVLLIWENLGFSNNSNDYFFVGCKKDHVVGFAKKHDQ